jgi:hypothetical protein
VTEHLFCGLIPQDDPGLCINLNQDRRNRGKHLSGALVRVRERLFYLLMRGDIAENARWRHDLSCTVTVRSGDMRRKKHFPSVCPLQYHFPCSAMTFLSYMYPLSWVSVVMV